MENKKEPLMSAELYYDNNNNDKTTTSELMQDYANYVTQWQQQQNKNLYSEEEVLKLLHNYRNHFELYRNIQVLPNDFFGWFNQNKKK